MTFDMKLTQNRQTIAARAAFGAAAGRSGDESAGGEPLRRDQVPAALTWDLTPVFESPTAWEAAFEAAQAALPELGGLAGRLGETPQGLGDALEIIRCQRQALGLLHAYARLKHDEDTTNDENAARLSRITVLMAEFDGEAAFVEPELAAIPQDIWSAWMSVDSRLAVYRYYFEELNRLKPHLLSDREERLLGKASQILDQNDTVFSLLNDADLIFPTVRNGQGDSVRLTHGRYSQLMEASEQSVRRAAFEGYYSVYRQFNRTFAGTLGGQVRTDNYLAEIRGYGSARERAMNENNIPESVHEHLISAVNERLSLLHRYVRLRRKALGLEELHSYDLYAPMVSDFAEPVTYERAKKTVLEALRPMGGAYLNIVEQAFSARWIDVCENTGKTSGAYSGGTYGTPPYILLNWRDTVNMMYTLIHELGHSVHSWYSRAAQPDLYSDYSIFLAEIASTTNENLLTRHLLSTARDEGLKAYIAAHYLDGFKATVFRQTQFAEFEHAIHEAGRRGAALTADYLNETYGELNRRYYGADLVFDPEIAFEWSRIPHFYYNYYVYQYATGFSAATAFADRILSEGQPAVDAYIRYLKAGSSAPPIEVLRAAGLDMTTPEPVHRALDAFERTLDLLETR